MRQIAFRLVLCLFLIVGSNAQAAEDDEDFLATESTVVAEFERQIAAPAPSADSPQELCVFLHKRGVAHMRLGHYDKALIDLRQALDMKQPPSPDRWCDRWPIQGDITGALHSTGDWLLLADFTQALSDEYKNNKWRYFFSQLRLIDPYVYLGKLREAEQAFQRASETLPNLRQQKRADPANIASALERYSAYAAWMQ